MKHMHFFNRQVDGHVLIVDDPQGYRAVITFKTSLVPRPLVQYTHAREEGLVNIVT